MILHDGPPCAGLCGPPCLEDLLHLGSLSGLEDLPVLGSYCPEHLLALTVLLVLEIFFGLGGPPGPGDLFGPGAGCADLGVVAKHSLGCYKRSRTGLIIQQWALPSPPSSPALQAGGRVVTGQDSLLTLNAGFNRGFYSLLNLVLGLPRDWIVSRTLG